LRTLAEKHVCGKTEASRKGRKMDPEKKLERQKTAAVNSFEKRMAKSSAKGTDNHVVPP